MSKDPAFLFYSSDFLTGVADLTFEERGQYITLLCLQHQKGRLRKKAIQIAVPGLSDDVLKKFEQDENGLFFNERLEFEAGKRAKHAEKQRQRAIDGWKKRKQKESHGNATASATAMPLENENENENEIVNRNKSEVETENKDIAEKKEAFNFWWDAYDKKVDRKKCEKKFLKLSVEEMRQCYEHTKKYVLATKDSQFRRNPLTYLNNENWKEEHLTIKRQSNREKKSIHQAAQEFRDIVDKI